MHYSPPQPNLPVSIQDRLANEPEWAMDCQIVDFKMKDGSVTQRVVVSGCRYAQMLNPHDVVDIVRVHTR